MIILDKIENLDKYPEYAKIGEFLKRNGYSLAPGRYEVDDECYMASSEYNTATDDGVFEGHIRYTDVQIVVEGEEYVWVQDVSRSQLTVPYDESRDVAFYTADSRHGIYLSPGFFLVLEPEDIHRPGVAIRESSALKKYVFKVKRA